MISTLEAQNFERYRPQPLPPALPEQPQLEEPLEPVTGSDKVLLESMKALIVLDDAEKVDPEGGDPEAIGLIRNFASRKSLVYSNRFEWIAQKYLNQPVSLLSLNQLSRDIITLYRECGQPVIDVLIPEQKITSGVIQIVVVEARIGQVRVQEGCYFDACETSKWIECTRRGGAIYEPWLENDLYWLNQNPFRRVGVDLKPGSTAGTTDILFTTEDVFPVRGYVGYDDTGVRSLGLERLSTGFIMGNVFGGDEIVSYQYTTDSDLRRLHAHAATYTEPISRDWTFQTYGSWAGVDPTIGGGFNQGGESWQTGFAFVRTLEKNRYVDENLTAGFDFKSTNNNLEFGGANVLNSSADLAQLRFGYQYLERDDYDQYSRLTWDNFIGPGSGFTSQSNPTAFNTIRAGTSPSYYYTRLAYEEALNVGCDWQLTFRGVGQLSSERLLWSEMLGFGGFDSIRGYDQRTANGDHGWIASLEFGPRPIPVCIQGKEGRLRLYTFMDSGQAMLVDALPGENGEQTMVSAGVGMRLNVAQDLSFRLDYGHAFQEVFGQECLDRLHLGLVWQFGRLP